MNADGKREDYPPEGGSARAETLRPQRKKERREEDEKITTKCTRRRQGYGGQAKDTKSE